MIPNQGVASFLTGVSGYVPPVQNPMLPQQMMLPSPQPMQPMRPQFAQPVAYGSVRSRIGMADQALAGNRGVPSDNREQLIAQVQAKLGRTPAQPAGQFGPIATNFNR